MSEGMQGQVSHRFDAMDHLNRWTLVDHADRIRYAVAQEVAKQKGALE